MNVLTMLVGARLDKHNLIDKLIFSPRVNLLYKPTEDFQARLLLHRFPRPAGLR